MTDAEIELLKAENEMLKADLYNNQNNIYAVTEFCETRIQKVIDQISNCIDEIELYEEGEPLKAIEGAISTLEEIMIFLWRE